MTPDRIAHLIYQYCMETISDADLRVLEDWRNESEANERIFQTLIDNKTVADYLEIESRIQSVVSKKSRPQASNVIAFLRRYVVPAAAILLLCLGVFVWRIMIPIDKNEIAKTETTPPVQDIAPGKFKAKLQLADGREIILDESNTGLLAKQDESEIYNKGNRLEYSTGQPKNTPASFNTLITNTGETFPVQLSDGTKVWLNSRSSIKFPVSFNGSERKVEITGEVYFEVQKNGKPFRVTVMNPDKPVEVQVLGTHFNINAYEDELTVKTTLLEGKVAVRTIKTNETQFIQPGQQVIVDQQGVARVYKQVDTNVVTAWKNQDFYFERDDLKTVMRQLSRWYGVNVTYEGNVGERQFSGQIRRSRNLSEVLNMLKGTDIHFTIEGKNLTVKP